LPVKELKVVSLPVFEFALWDAAAPPAPTVIG
jgi:hypothetical protein